MHGGVLTIDLPGGRNTETQSILMREDDRTCSNCHIGCLPMFDDMRVGLNNPALTWEVIGRMKEVTSMNVIIKGVEVGADAALVCNMVLTASGSLTMAGGQLRPREAQSSVCPTSWPPWPGADHRRQWISSGHRHLQGAGSGSRPYCWGLGAFGQAGVERVLDLLNRELLITMRGSVRRYCIGPDYVHDAGYRVPRAASCCRRDFELVLGGGVHKALFGLLSAFLFRQRPGGQSVENYPRRLFAGVPGNTGRTEHQYQK